MKLARYLDNSAKSKENWLMASQKIFRARIQKLATSSW